MGKLKHKGRLAAAAVALLLIIICVLRPAAPDPPPENAEPLGPIIAVLGQDGNIFQIHLEEFLVGVVAAEMPASFGAEALAAQAVAARTYILAAQAGGGRHEQAVVCCDFACCQAWREPNTLAAADREKVAAAVAVTAGQALFYQDSLAEAPFCSCCGGRTESAAAVWGGERPWLVSVDCAFCGHAPRFCSSRLFSLSEAAALLDCTEQELRRMELLGLSEGGRVTAVALGGRALSGREVRSALGLDSAAFVWLIQGQRMLVASLGFGHGVGLCQWGADGMARSGADCRQILDHYYPGCQLQAAYSVDDLR